MEVINHENTTAPIKWFAVVDAAKRNLKYKQQYSQRQQARAVSIKDLLDCAYNHSGIYINYRKKFIAVKIAAPQVKNPAVRNALLDMCTGAGYPIVSTDQGMIIRLNTGLL